MFLSRIKAALLQLDLFWSTQYFRYREQPQYRTLTGGVCSILLIIICVVVFSSSVVGTFNKDSISWQYGLTQQTDLEFAVKVNTDSQAKFMFAVGVNNIDMTASPRYFDYKLTQEVSVGGETSEVSYALQPCKRKDWEGAGQRILSIFDRKNFSTHLCPVAGDSFLMTGMSTSDTYKFMKVSVLQCNPNSTLALTSPCADTSILNAFLSSNANFILNFYFVNPLINPSDPTAIRYYLEDRNYVPFNFQFGGEVNLYMARYSVTTDEEILPYQNLETQRGGIVNSVGQYIPTRKFGNVFGSVNFKKSALSLDVVRNYTKLDTTLSYVGGLFGFLMVFFVFMKVYTQYSYEVEMADRLYSYDRNDPLQSQKFHFGTFMGYVLYRLGSVFGEVKWQSMRKYDQCRQQIQKQFDVCFLMRRVIFLERSLRVVLEDHQFKGLHMHEKMTLKEAQELRGYYRLRDRIRGEERDREIGEREGEGDGSDDKQSGAVNVTDDLLGNHEVLPREDSSGLEMEFKESKEEHAKGQPQRGTKRRKMTQQISNTFKQKQLLNESEAVLRPLSSIRGNPHPPTLKDSSLPSPSSSHALKLLQKDSLSGNRISRRIYQGFSTDILKNILLKIEEDREQQPTDQNEIVIEENEEDFEIRISKRRVRPTEAQAEEKQEEDRTSKKNDQEGVVNGSNLPLKKQQQSSPVQIEMERSNVHQIANEFQFIP